MKTLIFKFFSAALYTVVLIFMLHLVNIFVNWIFGYIVGPVFDWFYRISILYKILLIFIGAPSILYIFFDLSKATGLYINSFILKVFPENSATLIISIVLVFSNIVLSIMEIWNLVHWDFWIILLWLIMVIFIIEMNSMFLLKKNKKPLN